MWYIYNIILIHTLAAGLKLFCIIVISYCPLQMSLEPIQMERNDTSKLMSLLISQQWFVSSSIYKMITDVHWFIN